MASVSQFLSGKPAGVEQVNRFNPQQQDVLQQLLNSGSKGLQNPYQGFEPIEQKARSQFQKQTVPSLAERFTSMGGHGTAALSSPAFASQLGSAGAGLEEGLAAQRSQYGMQNQSQLMQLLGLGLTPQYQNYQTNDQPGFLESYGPALAGLLGRSSLDYLNGSQGQQQSLGIGQQDQGPTIGQQGQQQQGQQQQGGNWDKIKPILQLLARLAAQGGLAYATGGASSGLGALT